MKYGRNICRARDGPFPDIGFLREENRQLPWLVPCGARSIEKRGLSFKKIKYRDPDPLQLNSGASALFVTVYAANPKTGV
jgi:hypothetical protein